MINVLDATTLEQFKEFVFRNFREAADRLNAVNADEAIAAGTAQGGGGGTGLAPATNIFDVVYLGDTSTKIYKDASGNLVFEDIHAGAITLSQIATLLSILWTSGSAYGIRLANAAGTVRLLGITEDADGLVPFNDTTQVE